MLPIFVGLVAELTEEDLPFAELAAVAAALDKQVTRDFGPIWGVSATVSAFHQLEDVPEDYLKLYIREAIGSQGAFGVHRDDHGQVFALVEFRSDWPLWASHELLEMLADPSLNRMVAGDSPKTGQGRVEFLVEVCDPCQSPEHAYPVNEIHLSDFVTPQYFDPVFNAGNRYSFNGSIGKPHEVLPGGYLSWRTPDDHFWQADFQSGVLTFTDGGLFPKTAGAALRSFVDSRTKTDRTQPRMGSESVAYVLARARRRRSERARAFCQHVEALDALQAGTDENS
jgi:hypothetical protein